MKIGMCNGAFDLLHDGHFYYLAQCASACDFLIVALNSDASVRRNKGAPRPMQDWCARQEALYDTELVMSVIPFEGRWDRLAMEIRPHVIFQGQEYDRGLGATLGCRAIGWKERDAAFDLIPIIYIERLPGISTTLQIASRARNTDA